mmetsp:Transcript_20548/g.15150  ORF Transcript_20548/g.15150 Transcript_20548/m.15150 type:complete len:86 (-) Transcript_20548:967-1224(-)
MILQVSMVWLICPLAIVYYESDETFEAKRKLKRACKVVLPTLFCLLIVTIPTFFFASAYTIPADETSDGEEESGNLNFFQYLITC